MSSGFINPAAGVIPGSSPDFTRVFSGNGSAAAPSFAFTSDPDTGFYSAAANEIGVSCNGANTATFKAGGKLALATHTTAAGGIDFGADVNLYRVGANQLKTDDQFFASSIDNTPIGVNTRAAGAFTTIDASLALSVGQNSIGANQINFRDHTPATRWSLYLTTADLQLYDYGTAAVVFSLTGTRARVLVATEATTGGAGAFTTAGGIYASKKIISGSTFSPSGSSVIWAAGAGSPEGVITAPVGSIYSRTDGGAVTSFYVKESGAGNTGWVAK